VQVARRFPFTESNLVRPDLKKTMEEPDDAGP